MPVLLKNYRVNDYSRRMTVYSKLKRITDSGFDTSNDYFSEGFTRLLGINNESLTKDYFSSQCNDIIYVSGLNLHIACGTNWWKDTRSKSSTFLYSEDNGVSWTFSTDTFEPLGNDFLGAGSVLIFSNSIIFCGGTGGAPVNRKCLMKSSDGKNWTNVSCPLLSIYNMVTDGSGKILVSGPNQSGKIDVLMSQDNGITWQTISDFTSATSGETVYSADVIFINNRYYIGIYLYNGICTILTSADLNTWTDISGNFTANSTLITIIDMLSSVYYDNGVYILCLELAKVRNYPPVFHSSDGINFVGSTGISNRVSYASNVIYNSNDSIFYLSAQYPADLNNSSSLNIQYFSSLNIMYFSTDGATWTPLLNNDAITNLPSSISNYIVLGISHFYIDNSTNSIYAIGLYSRVYAGNPTYFSFGLLNIDLDGTIIGDDPIALNGETCNKLFINNSSVLVGMGYGTAKLSLVNSIYYALSPDVTLLPTEHADDV
jgi:hypothetical protein